MKKFFKICAYLALLLILIISVYCILTWPDLRARMYFYILGDYPKALEDYNRVVDKFPNQAWPYQSRAMLKMEMSDYEGVVEDLTAALTKNTGIILKDFGTSGSYYFKCRAEIELGRYNEAITDCTEAISLASKEKLMERYIILMYDFRGDAYNNTNNYEYALKDFNKVLELNPNYSYAYYKRAGIKIQLNDANGALDDYNRAIALNPNAKTYAGRSFLKSAILENQHGALEDITKAIELDPKDSNFYNTRGIIQRALKNYLYSLEDLNKAIELNPNFVLPYFNRGKTKNDLKDYKGALEDFNYVLKTTPEDLSSLPKNGKIFYANVYESRAETRKALGDNQGAKDDENLAKKLFNN